MHPFWQGFHDRERYVALDYGRHPAWVHGWQEADEYLSEQAEQEPGA